jgi:hypothetical protein
LNSSKINPAREPKARGGHKPCAGKTEVLQETFWAQGFGQVSSPGLWFPRQFTLLCSTGFYAAMNIAVLPEGGDQEKTGGHYTDIGNLAASKIAESKHQYPG